MLRLLEPEELAPQIEKNRRRIAELDPVAGADRIATLKREITFLEEDLEIVARRSQPETIDPLDAKSVAFAVFEGAFSELKFNDLREDALEFLRVTAWTGETPWAEILRADRQAVLRRVDAILEAVNRRGVAA